MWVTILATEYEKYTEYHGATLWLPTTMAAIQDAMEQVRVPENGSYRLTRLDGWPKFLAERLSRMEADIQEVNVLAAQIEQIGRENISWYEGVIGCVESERGDRECSVKDLINAAGNLDNFCFLLWQVLAIIDFLPPLFHSVTVTFFRKDAIFCFPQISPHLFLIQKRQNLIW